MAAALFALGLYTASLPESLRLLRTPCPVASCALTTGQLTVGDLQVLRTLGVSLDAYAAYWIALYAGVGLACFIVGAVLAWRKSEEWVALLVSLMLINLGAFLTLGNVAAGASIWSLPAQCFSTVNGFVALCTFAVFPTGRPVPRWAGWVPLAFPAASLTYLLVLRPLHIAGWSWNQNPLSGLAFWGSWIILTAAQVYRYRHVSTSVERQQTKWVAFGFVVLLVASVADAVVNNALSLQREGVLYVLLSSVLTVVVLILPLCFALAILRHRLWDIDLILNRALVYTALTASVVSVYVLIVAGLGALVQRQDTGVLSLLATALVALLFHPLRARLQRGVNRLLYGDRDEPYAVVSRLGRQLEGTLAPDAVLPAIVQTVAQALKVPYVAMTLQQDAEFSVATAIGTPGGPLVRLPLVYQGETVGELALSPRPGEGAFAASDRRLLEDLARQAGVAASAVRLTADLQRSRERLVTTREEERRRLRRDLHDGFGPALASMLLQAETAHDLLRSEPDESAALLAGLIEQLSTATAEIRRLVYDLRPPALDDLGLGGAIRAQARQYAHPALQIQLDLPDALPPLPAAVEVAVLRIVQEALTNVVRHAQAHCCTIRLAVGDLLELEIADDGHGLPAQVQAGVGLISMRERAAELGGNCRVEPGPGGGVRVCARLPVTTAGAAGESPRT